MIGNAEDSLTGEKHEQIGHDGLGWPMCPDRGLLPVNPGALIYRSTRLSLDSRPTLTRGSTRALFSRLSGSLNVMYTN
jgi:hypothetical protein